ncbi:MAG: hypothetical protein GY809_31480 [Planctomycetes bacterium]|nr:hypothetical protein [Planctomycetota bacterium]
MKVIPIQDTGNQVGKAGAVAPGVTAEYPGEAETITLGFAPGKSYDSVGIGRHGNFMLWGWSAAPSKMTQAGQKLFLNCLSYIHQFDQKPFVKIPQRAMARTIVDMLFNRMEQYPKNAKSYLSNYFPEDLTKTYEGHLDGMRKHYETHFDLIYATDRKFCVDEDLKSLGIESNRDKAMLKTLIGLLSDPSKAQRVQACLARYTDQSFDSPQAWRQWHEEAVKGLIFSDVGGYRFYDVTGMN